MNAFTHQECIKLIKMDSKYIYVTNDWYYLIIGNAVLLTFYSSKNPEKKNEHEQLW